ncbi:MAG TPA: hypothetical protein VNR39_14920 [Pseudolabrys sp.]|nr:hypothetical protein [Pseudolabrys sp.]
MKPRAFLKVSDDFTVPVRQTHNQELHQAGNERNWWEQLDIVPLESADQLCEPSFAELLPAVGRD